MKIDEIKELMRLFEASGVEKMRIKQKDFEIEMKKNSKTDAKSSNLLKVDKKSKDIKPTKRSINKKIEGEVIYSPMVGVFYSSPSPDSPPFVKPKDIVKKGEVICILEAMEKMNELEVEYDCKILDILVADGEAVDYEKPLFIVERL